MVNRDENGRFIKGHLLGKRFKKGIIPWTKLNKGKYKCESYNLTKEGKEQKIKNLGNGMLKAEGIIQPNASTKFHL